MSMILNEYYNKIINIRILTTRTQHIFSFKHILFNLLWFAHSHTSSFRISSVSAYNSFSFFETTFSDIQ
jgi:hypothetical protein